MISGPCRWASWVVLLLLGMHVVVRLLTVSPLADLVGSVGAQRAGGGVLRALADLQVAAGLVRLQRVVLRVRRGIAAVGDVVDASGVGRIVGLLTGEAAGVRRPRCATLGVKTGLLHVGTAGVGTERTLLHVLRASLFVRLVGAFGSGALGLAFEIGHGFSSSDV